MKQRIKRWLFRMLGKDPEAVVVSFCTGDAALCGRMVDEVRELVPDRRHFVVTPENWPQMREELRGYRIGLAPVMLANVHAAKPPVRGARRLLTQRRGDAENTLKMLPQGLSVSASKSVCPTAENAAPGSVAQAVSPASSDFFTASKEVISLDALRRAAYRLAPRKILAYNSRLERHHLRLDLPSLLFWGGVPLDRIYLRPWWWPWRKRERSVVPTGYQVLEGRACSPERQRVAMLAPYFPYPLAHGGAVRIFNLLRETAREFDVELFAFTDQVGQTLPPADSAPVLEFCARAVLVEKPRYREPRWSSLLPPEVHEFRSPAMRRALAEERRAFAFAALQVEYTQLAEYGGDALVEHDVTFDLFDQLRRGRPTLTAWWNWFRWHRFEARAIKQYRRVVVMSKKDAELLGAAVPCTVLENGVDLDRFRPEPEPPGQRLLFIGSFRHFPNVTAYRFFTGSVWPLLRDRFPEMTLTVVCGPEHLTYWRAFTDSPEPAPDPRIRLLGFVADVRPLYVETNLAIVPTTVSAGTNVKVLEAMAMQRAIVSTPSGCAGLGLVHGRSVWEAETAEAFAAGVAALIADPERRAQMALAAYGDAKRNFDWRAIGERQRELLRDLVGST